MSLSQLRIFLGRENEIKPFPNEMHALVAGETFHSLFVATAKTFKSSADLAIVGSLTCLLPYDAGQESTFKGPL